MRKNYVLFSLLFGILTGVYAQDVFVDVNLNVQHKLDTVTKFDRRKFVNIHADAREPDWENGTNEVGDARADFLTGYDVYLGRTTHNVNGPLNNQITQDPARAGFASPSSIASVGTSIKNTYAATTRWHAYEWRDDEILCNLDFPFMPVGDRTNLGWSFSQTDTEEQPFGTASGEFYGRFIRDAYGTGGLTGPPAPKYIEIVNEPMWPLFDYSASEWYHSLTFEQLHRFHRTVAQQVHFYNPQALVGGYVTAFCNFEEENFGRWNRWKQFIDIAGDEMDFWSIHIYDAPEFNGREVYQKGSNMEGTFDMIEQYTYLKYGYQKPFVISEFGAADHEGSGLPWSHYHDLLQLKSVNSMMLQFMERANIMLKTINYVMLKGSWTGTTPETVWGSRLFRHKNEPASVTGNWVYTDLVKTYQLWSDVKGTRVESRATNPDILTDAYVNGNKAYVIINSLDFETHTVGLHIAGVAEAPGSIKVRQLYGTGLSRAVDSAVFSEVILTEAPDELTLPREGTYILEYTYPSVVAIDETMTEEKLYSDTYLQSISANTNITFHINGANVGSLGEAILRVGLGRAHGRSLQPQIMLNGVQIAVPENYRGDNQEDRGQFFGVLEIPVPYYLLNENNTVVLRFPDAGGYVTTVTMQTFELSAELYRSDAVSGVSIYPSTVSLGVGQLRVLTANVLPSEAIDKRVVWESSNEAVVTVDADGNITGQAVGTASVSATTVSGNYTAQCQVEVVANRVDVLVDSVVVSPAGASVVVGSTLQLSYEILPVDADDQTISWSSESSAIASVSNGLVTGVADGTTRIKATATNGKYGYCDVTAITSVPGWIAFDNVNNYLNTAHYIGTNLEIACSFAAKTGDVVGPAGVKFWLREITADWSVVHDYTATDVSVAGQESGTASASIALTGMPLTAELAPGHFYFLWISFNHTDESSVVVNGVWPIQIENQPDSVEVIDAMTAHASENIRVFPNPVKSALQIRGMEPGNYELAIYNLQGMLVEEKTLSLSTETRYDVSNLRDGMYILKLTNGSVIYTKLFHKLME